MTFFTPDEFRCRCGRPACEAPRFVVDDLIERLTWMRTYLGAPIRITSGLRCAEQNARVGGAPDSEHLTGEGADLAVQDARHRWALVQAAQRAGLTRLGIARTFLHVGVSRTLPQHVLWTYDRAVPA